MNAIIQNCSRVQTTQINLTGSLNNPDEVSTFLDFLYSIFNHHSLCDGPFSSQREEEILQNISKYDYSWNETCWYNLALGWFVITNLFFELRFPVESKLFLGLLSLSLSLEMDFLLRARFVARNLW